MKIGATFPPKAWKYMKLFVPIYLPGETQSLEKINSSTRADKNSPSALLSLQFVQSTGQNPQEDFQRLSATVERYSAGALLLRASAGDILRLGYTAHKFALYVVLLLRVLFFIHKLTKRHTERIYRLSD